MDTTLIGQEPNTTIFHGDEGVRLLELRGNGDILVKGKLIENDVEVVDALRDFLKNKKNK